MKNKISTQPDIEVLPDQPLGVSEDLVFTAGDSGDVMVPAPLNMTKNRGHMPRVVVETATNVVQKATKKVGPPKEDDRQRKAFEYYFSLGENRTLVQVASHFNLKPDLIGQWSYRKNWIQRIKDLEARGVGQIIEDTSFQVILSRLQGMFIPDPMNPTKVIVDPKAPAGALKDLIAAYVSLEKNARERKEEGSESGGQNGTGKGKNQFLVNVIIEK